MTAKPYWPERPGVVGLEPLTEGGFKPSVGKTIPSSFWGEFAEDVHDCGGEATMLVKKDQIVRAGDKRETISTVRWKEPTLIEVDGIDELFTNVSFQMRLSDDRDEITIIYTNMKQVVQRCSTRSHESPEVLKSAPIQETDDPIHRGDENMSMDIDSLDENLD